MKKSTLAIAALLAALGGSAFAQTTSTDPIVQARAEQRAANQAFAEKVIKAHNDRSAKVNAAVDAAVREAAASGKDPLVARRDAEAKANKATKAEYDAQLKALSAERKAAVTAASKKAAAAPKS